ncbi:hypothetical protein QZH41_019367, partial [Actinostola sp. cb2023]
YQHIRMYDISSANPKPLMQYILMMVHTHGGTCMLFTQVVNYDGVTKNVTAVGFHEDGKWMFTGGEDSSARIWDLRSRNLQCQRVFQVNAAVNCVCLHPNQIPDENASVLSISIDREASYMAAVNNKGKCYVWSLSGGTNEDPTVLHPKTKIDSHAKYALKCQFSPDSCLLATTSGDQTVKIWQTADFSLKTTLKDPTQRWVWDCAFSEDSQYLVTASSDNIARLWNVDAGEVVREYKGHQKAVVCLAFRDAQVN